MTPNDRESRAEAARRMILASGNPDLINRLHLLDAAAPGTTAGPAAGAPAPAPAPTSGQPAASPWGTAAAAGAGALGGVMLGSVLGTVLGGMMLDAPMRAAFAALAEEAGFDPDTITATLASLPAPLSTDAPSTDPLSTAPEASDVSAAGDDDSWFGGLFDI